MNNDMHDQDDAELLQLIRNRETIDRGFSLLLKKYRERVYWNVRRMVISHEDADDLVQNIFIKVFRHADSFRGDSTLYTWIYRITVNETLTFLKSKRNTLFTRIGSREQLLADALEDEHHFRGSEIQKKLQQAILKLPEKQRLVFNMKYYDEELTFEELSKILDTSAGALKASYHHAVKKIEKYLRDH